MKEKAGMSGFLQSHPARFVFFALSALTVLWAVVNYPVMITLWRHGFDDGTYSHAYLIPFIFLYLLYVLANKGELTPRQAVFWPAVVSFVVLFIAYYFSIAAQLSLAVWVLSLAILANSFWLLVPFTAGLAYTVAFLLFMYPLWGALQFVLQHLSVFAVMKIMGFTGIPTYVENTSVMIPEGTFVIAGGCSGLRYFIVSLAIGSLFVFLNLRNKVSIAKFMTLAIVGALITNWIRIVALILIGHFSDMQSELMRDHNNFGWYIYAPFIILLFWYGEKLVKKEPAAEEHSPEPGTGRFALRKPVVVTSVCFLILSSAALQLTLHADPAPPGQTCKGLSAIDAEVAPVLPYEGAVCVKEQRSQGYAFDTLSILFDGSDLDGKPTQYQVKSAPVEWQEINRITDGSWTIQLVSDSRHLHLFAHSFIAPGGEVASEGEMKKLRIENALRGERRSGLLWAHTVCDSNCNTLTRKWQLIADAFEYQKY